MELGSAEWMGGRRYRWDGGWGVGNIMWWLIWIGVGDMDGERIWHSFRDGWGTDSLKMEGTIPFPKYVAIFTQKLFKAD